MQLSSLRLTHALSWEDRIHNVSNYNITACYLVSMCCYLKYSWVDDLLFPALFSFMLDYSRIISTFKIP